MARKTEKADNIDKHIGNIIKTRREVLNITQSELAAVTGVSYQQIHKYEKGVNRISAGRLALIAFGLDAPIQDFYEEIYTGIRPSPYINVDNRLSFELSRNFHAIENHGQREALYLLIKTIAESGNPN